jgi:UPF0755 protein
MPESRSSFDDPLADLFGSLPHPRRRTGETDPFGSAPRTRDIPLPIGSEADGFPPRPDTPPTQATTPTPLPAVSPTSETSPAPTSRRAARAAAAAQSDAPGPPPPLPPATTGATPTAAPSSTTDPSFDDLFGPAPVSAPAPVTGAYARGDDASGDASSTGPSPVPTPQLEDLFTGNASSDDLGSPPPPVNKRRRRAGGWIALGIVLLLFGGIAAGGWYVWTTYEDKIREFMGWEEPKDYEEGMAEGEALLTIVSGDTGATISTSLYEAGVTKTPEAFYEYLVDTAQNPPFVPGVFKLQQKMTSEAALEALMNPANKLENSALLREGLTVDQSISILSESLGIPLEDFQAAVADPTAYGVPVDPEIAAAGGQPLEGWLFPAMYTFDPGVTAKDVIGTLVTRTMTSLGDAGVPEADRHKILTIASIIQREGRAADFDKVSRVIQNRLSPDNEQTFGKLEMDSTAQYGFGEMHDGTASSSQEALDDPNPWNTYYHTGLPIGPIANPGDEAIKAAMHPADGPWFYFVTWNMDTGETIFSSTYSEHQQGIQKWEEWCAANDYRGC